MAWLQPITSTKVSFRVGFSMGGTSFSNVFKHQGLLGPFAGHFISTFTFICFWEN